MRPFRSVLFVPGHKPTWVDKAVASPAQTRSCSTWRTPSPTELKIRARHQVAESLHHLTQLDERPGVFVRTNALESRHTGQDMEAVAVHGLDGFFCPKIRGPLDVVRYATLIDHAESCNSLRGGPAADDRADRDGRGHPALRGAAGRLPRVGAMIGATARHADVAREVGFTFTPEGLESLYLRSKVLLACRATGVHALTGLWEDVNDLDGLEDFARAGRGLGLPRADRHPPLARRGRQPRVLARPRTRSSSTAACSRRSRTPSARATVRWSTRAATSTSRTCRPHAQWLAQVDELEHMAG